MKTNHYFFYFIGLLSCFAASCESSSSHNTVVIAKDTVIATVPISLNPIQNDFEDLALEGMLDNKYPIFMQLTKSDNAIFGEMLYKKTGLPISLEGSQSDKNTWTLSEKGDKDLITGIFEGIFENNIYKGKWLNPKTNKTIPFELLVSEKVIDEFKKGGKVQPKTLEIEGKYGCTDSNFTFTKVSETEYLFSFIGSWQNGNGAVHTGELEGAATLKNGKLYFQGDKADDLGNCAFAATFKGEKMTLESTSDDIDCGFGANVSFGTVYTKE